MAFVDRYAFPQCCTGQVIAGFGGTHTAAYNKQYDPNPTKLKRDIKAHINIAKDSGKAFVAATTNNKQKVANKVLRELGFIPSKWMSKEQHPETKVRLWYLPLN